MRYRTVGHVVLLFLVGAFGLMFLGGYFWTDQIARGYEKEFGAYDTDPRIASRWFLICAFAGAFVVLVDILLWARSTSNERTRGFPVIPNQSKEDDTKAR